MLNIHARAFFSRGIAPLGERLARAGVTPDAITVIGTIGAVAAALVFFPQGAGSPARCCAGPSSCSTWSTARWRARAVARQVRRRARLVLRPDRRRRGLRPSAWYFARHGQRWLLLAALLCLVLGSLTSYIRARAEAAGLTATVGIAERAERLIIVLVGTGLSGDALGVPYVQAIALWLLVAASTITVVPALRHGVPAVQARRPPREP